MGPWIRKFVTLHTIDLILISVLMVVKNHGCVACISDRMGKRFTEKIPEKEIRIKYLVHRTSYIYVSVA